MILNKVFNIMHLDLKHNYSRLKMFLVVSVLLGLTLCLLQFVDIFLTVDSLILSLDVENQYSPLPTVVMFLVIMFHTIFPGIIILEEGSVKGVIYTVVSWFFYGVLIHSYSSSYSLYIPLTAPLIGCLVSIIRVLAWEHSFLTEEKNEIKRTLGSLVEPSVAEFLLKNPDLLKQDGVRKTVTIMFADLRGFTKLCEVIAPEQLFAMLRDCFGKLISIVRSNGGTIDKLVGDSMMVVWGNPVPMDNHAEKAVEAAIEMQAMMQSLKKKWQQKLGVDIMLGIGINTDEVVAGSIGSEEFCDYTVLGCGVNLASRLESICPGGLIYVSGKTHLIVNGMFELEELDVQKDKNNCGISKAYKVIA
jgi:adenylate cyclase